MKLKLYITFFIGLSLFIFSCKTASKLYEKGNYDEAVEVAAKKLQKDPNDSKLLDIITNSYTYAVNDHESRIQSLSQSTNELKYESIYNEYRSLQRMYEAIYKVPSVLGIVNPINYSEYLVTYSQKAGDVRYERGIAFMQRYTKKSYQDAYREFQIALRFNPGNRDASIKLNEAYEYAVTNVVVLPVLQYGGYIQSSYSANSNYLDEQLIRNLKNRSGNEFVKFYSVWEARRDDVRIDQEVELSVANLHIGRQYDNSTRRKVSKEIIIKEIVFKPDSVVREYANVNATVISTTRRINSSLSLQINVRNSEGQRIWNDNVNAIYNWSTVFATFNGDERALSADDKLIVNKRKEFAPPASEIERNLYEIINNDVLYRIKNYFNRY